MIRSFADKRTAALFWRIRFVWRDREAWGVERGDDVGFVALRAAGEIEAQPAGPGRTDRFAADITGGVQLPAQFAKLFFEDGHGEPARGLDRGQRLVFRQRFHARAGQRGFPECAKASSRLRLPDNRALLSFEQSSSGEQDAAYWPKPADGVWLGGILGITPPAGKYRGARVPIGECGWSVNWGV